MKTVRFLRYLGLLLAGPIALAGCDAFRSFDAVCEARLPATRVSVEAEPVSYTVDHSLSFAQLTQKGSALVSHGTQVLGLTEANLRTTVSVNARGLGSRITGRYCMRPEVSVKLTFNPMKIYMGANEPEGSCGYNITWDHELRHVAAYQSFLPDFAARVERELTEHFGNTIYKFASDGEAQQHVDELVAKFLSPLVQNGMQEVRVSQRRVDSPLEYARLDQLRGGCR
jgi:hypothetical protein